VGAREAMSKFSFNTSNILELRKCYIMSGMPAVADRPEKIFHPATSSLDLATIMRTLGDPVRLEILRLLADGRPRLCGEISSALGLPTSTSSYHLRLLREAGVTHSRAAGTQRDLNERFPGLVDVLTR
jgi:DNA-binding transcriptional ArsR family regulator